MTVTVTVTVIVIVHMRDTAFVTTLLDLPCDEIRALLSSGAPVYLPVNPVEYHGPHLSLHNDGLVSLGLIQDLHSLLQEEHPEWPLILMPDLEMGVEPVKGPGSRPVPFPEVSRAVVRACRALRAMGARAVVLMTFHGSPMHNLALEEGARYLRQHGIPAATPFPEVLRGMASGEGGRLPQVYAPVADEDERRKLISMARDDLHAGFLETSLAMHYRPDSVSDDVARVPPCPPIVSNRSLAAASRLAALAGRNQLAEELSFAALAIGWHDLDPFPGYTGHPHLANPETGAILARHIVTQGAPLVSAVLSGEAEPAPPFMGWIRHISLGGRLTAWESTE